MATLDQALVDARQRAGLHQADVARIMNITQPVVSLRESGRSRTFAEDLEKLAAATGLSISVTPSGWTVSSHPDPLPGNPDRASVYEVEQAGEGVPIFGRAGAGPGQFASELVDEWFDLRRRWLAQLDGLLEVHGDSMAPALSDGDLVGVRLFEEGDRPRLGEFVAAWIPDDDTVVVKVWAGYAGRDVRLLSTNVAYPHITAPRDRVVVKGRVTGALRMGGWRIPLVGYAEFDQALAQQIDDESDADTTY